MEFHHQLARLAACFTLFSFLRQTSANCPDLCRCIQTPSTFSPSQIERHVDCSGQLISNIQDVLSSLPNDTTVLDLRVNNIKTIGEDSFNDFTNLSVILLDDNLIDNIEPFAFRGLYNLRSLSLTKNRLETVRKDAFSGISGAEGVCGQGLGVSKQCGIYLQNNNIATVERHAFAWMKRLQVFLGDSRTPLSVEAYAFYGARWIPRLRISNVPSLVLHPRIFTNTEYLEYVEISSTRIEKLNAFIFEGLRNVKGITFNGVHITMVASFTFGGITFIQPPKPGHQDDPEDARQSRLSTIPEIITQGSTIVNFTSCIIDQMEGDVFRDTRVSHIHIENCRITDILANAFRGVSGLQSVRLVTNSMMVLKKDSLGSLQNLRELILDRNNISCIAGNAFAETSNIDDIQIILNNDMTLEREAFSGVYNVKKFHIYSASTPKASLVVQPGAFKNLVGVHTLRVSNVRLPILQGQSFGGMTRIVELQLASCDISHIERSAFGEVHSNNGAIERIDMSVGNNLTCDCQTTPVYRELIQKFMSCNLACRSPRSAGKMTQVNDESLTELLCIHANSGVYTSRSYSFAILLTLVFVSMIHSLNLSLNVDS